MFPNCQVLESNHCPLERDTEQQTPLSPAAPYNTETEIDQSKLSTLVFTVMRVALITPTIWAVGFPEGSYASKVNLPV